MAKPERVEYVGKWFNLTAPAPKNKKRRCAWCKKSVHWTGGTNQPTGFRCWDCTPEPDEY